MLKSETLMSLNVRIQKLDHTRTYTGPMGTPELRIIYEGLALSPTKNTFYFVRSDDRDLVHPFSCLLVKNLILGRYLSEYTRALITLIGRPLPLPHTHYFAQVND